ncbi:MAG: LacI family DNA-binding transcriptional regulator [Capsulimonadaceae bacterium]|nr:LacI family DNA-binding transcriptional regulator [Capsulimonadaceae bacterium]
MPTIDDVAKACGLSKATVSLVMNKSSLKVSAATRTRVMRVAKEMNYQPSARARSLSRQRADMIGVVTSRRAHLLADAYFGALIDSIVECAAEMDQTVAVYNGRIWVDDEKTQTVFGDGRCDGLLLLVAEDERALTAALSKSQVPFVTVNSSGMADDINSIDIDNVDAGYRMTRYLLDHGHRRIACLRTEDRFSIERLAGYKKAMAKAGEAFDPRLDVTGHYAPEVSGYVRAQQMLRENPLGITAIFAATDGLACDAIHGIKDLGLRVPDDISIVGINDTVDAVRCNPPLTTLRQSVESIGVEAVRLLMDLIRDPNQEARHIIWPTQLVVRETVAPPAPAMSGGEIRNSRKTGNQEEIRI